MKLTTDSLLCVCCVGAFNLRHYSHFEPNTSNDGRVQDSPAQINATIKSTSVPGHENFSTSGQQWWTLETTSSSSCS